MKRTSPAAALTALRDELVLRNLLPEGAQKDTAHRANAAFGFLDIPNINSLQSYVTTDVPSKSAQDNLAQRYLSHASLAVSRISNDEYCSSSVFSVQLSALAATSAGGRLEWCGCALAF
jgi:hypothetical protein